MVEHLGLTNSDSSDSLTRYFSDGNKTIYEGFVSTSSGIFHATLDLTNNFKKDADYIIIVFRIPFRRDARFH